MKLKFHKTRLDPAADIGCIPKVDIRPEPLRVIPETDRIKKRHAEVIICRERAKEGWIYLEASIGIEGLLQGPGKHSIDRLACKPLLWRTHVSPAITQYPGDIIIIVVREVPVVQPAIRIWVVDDA